MSLSYFKTGTREKPVISNSSLSALNPEEGGSIVKFLNFFQNEEEEKQYKTSRDKTNGSLIHRFIEEPKSFAIEAAKIPSDMMKGFLEKLVFLQSEVKNKAFDVDVDTTISSDAKKPETVKTEVMQITNGFEKLANILDVSTEECIKIFRVARHEAQAYTSKKELTLLNDLVPDDINAATRTYLNFLLNSRGKNILNHQDHAIVSGMSTSLSTHKAVSVLLGIREADFACVEETKVFKEQPVYWREIFDFEDGVKIPINCKALLDRLIINFTLKKITYIDLKSTRRSIYTFQTSFEEYRYYRQMAWYARAIKTWFKSVYPDLNLSEWEIEILVIPVQNRAPFTTGVYEVTKEWLTKGAKEAKELLGRYAWHVRYGEYQFEPEELNPDGSYKYLQFKNPT